MDDNNVLHVDECRVCIHSVGCGMYVCFSHVCSVEARGIFESLLMNLRFTDCLEWLFCELWDLPVCLAPSTGVTNG